jgi:hypothetical protein
MRIPTRLLLGVASAALLPASAYSAIVERPSLHGNPNSVSAYSVYPNCTVPSTTSTGNKWYFDPVAGQTPAYYAANPPATGIAGDQQHPWNSLVGAISGLWGTANVTPGTTYPGYKRPLLSSIPYLHFTTAGEPGLVPGEAIGKVFAADNVGNPPIHPGDTLLLMTGDYGPIQIGAPNLETTNSDFVRVEPGPGQAPIIDNILVYASTKWLFDGVTFQSIRTPTTGSQALVTVKDGGTGFPATDIVFKNILATSAPSTVVATWTAANWYANARTGFSITGSAGSGTNGEPYTTCVSITDSHITNVYIGTALFANNILFDHNEIDHAAEDMLDFGGNNLIITHVREHDGVTAGDGNHNDGMQGQAGALSIAALNAGVKYNQFMNVLIDSNTVIRRTDPNLSLPSPQGLQGIDAFDADWTNITVTNNVVISRTCWGISFASVHNGLFANNTVVDDGDTFVVEPNCTSTFAVGNNSHQGTATSNTRISNNLADTFELAVNATTGVTADHNVALNFYQGFQGYINGVWSYQWPAGKDANGNIAPAANIPYATQFVSWPSSPTTSWQYDVHLLPGSVAIGAGTSGGVLPTINIMGATRVAPWTVGAY